MTEKPTNYLDRILKFMGKDFNKYYNIQEIQNHLKSINLFDQKELKI